MRIAIAGYGLEGKANLKYFREKFLEAEFMIFDENATLADAPSGCELVLGNDAFAKIHDFDLVLRSAGIAPRKIGQKDKIWSATREFFANCPAPIIGVTGSKGKGTTCSFIYEILRAAGKTAHLVGNIGTPAIEKLPDVKSSDVVVYELSSFQLWDLEQSPHVAVMTLIEPDHLDVHANFAEYVDAKSHIFAYQKPGDVAVYNEADALVREIAEKFAKQNSVVAKPFLNKKFVHIEQGKFYYNNEEICETSVVKLPGEHNLRNAAAAIDAVWEIIGGDRNAIANGLSNFRGLPHRLKFIREVALGTSKDVQGVKFYDDSIATTPGSAIAALNSFRESKVLILGGHDKGADYREIGKIIAKLNREDRGTDDEPSVRAVIIFGASRDKMANEIREVSDVEIREIDTTAAEESFAKTKTNSPENTDKLNDISRNVMAEIVQTANELSRPGDTVILSPAASSFDLFNNYAERGDMFAAAVKSLGQDV